MSRLVIAAFLVLAITPIVSAQNGVRRSPSDQPKAPEAQASPQVSPEVLIYMETLKRYDDPKQAVRRKAEARAAQRRGRLASQKWFGYSPLRPIASPVPMMGTAAPMWVGNSYDPFRWVGPSPHATAVFRTPIVR